LLTPQFILEYGKELSYEESFLRQYYEAKDEWEYALMSGKQKLFPWRVESQIKSEEDWKKLQENYESNKEHISQMFLRAVDSHDGERIMNLARAVWFFEDKRHSNNFTLADRERTLLLFLKMLLERSGEKIPIKMVAQFLLLDDPKARKKMTPPADGYSTLRKKCIQLGIPLAESRKRNKK
jgi:hypothetical protein